MAKTAELTYYPNAKIICVCGNIREVGSTKPEIQVELCSNCHPFFTGKEKMLDTAGRVERFKKMSDQAQSAPKKVRKTTLLKQKQDQRAADKAAKEAADAEKRKAQKKPKAVKKTEAPETAPETPEAEAPAAAEQA